MEHRPIASSRVANSNWRHEVRSRIEYLIPTDTIIIYSSSSVLQFDEKEFAGFNTIQYVLLMIRAYRFQGHPVRVMLLFMQNCYTQVYTDKKPEITINDDNLRSEFYSEHQSTLSMSNMPWHMQSGPKTKPLSSIIIKS